jgi:hypothetical protein
VKEEERMIGRNGTAKSKKGGGRYKEAGDMGQFDFLTFICLF